MQARPPNHGFHETRNTRHESQLLRPPEPPRPPTSRCFSVHDCSLLFGIVQQKILPLSQCPLFVHIGNAAFMVLHGTRVTKHGFPRPCGDSRESNPKPDQRVFTKHETRGTNHGFYASLPTISHHFPRFPGISRPPTPPPPMKCPRAVRLSWSAARTAVPRRPVTAFLRAVGRLWSGMSGILPLSQCPRAVSRSYRRPPGSCLCGERRMKPC